MEGETLMEGVRDADGVETVYISQGSDGRPLIVAYNEQQYDATEVDLLDLLRWLKEHRPDLLKD